MLGSIVEVIPARRAPAAYGEEAGAVRGYIICGSAGEARREAAVITASPVVGRFVGRVVALWRRENGQCIPVVTARSRVLCEPEIRRALGLPARGTPGEVRCLYEKSCGAVVFRKEGRRVLFLVVKNKKGRNWGFPKGHMELGETEVQTALREIEEETGLKVTVQQGFRAVSRYTLWNKASKQVVFFLAQSETGDVTVQEEEIERAKWLPYPAAMNLFRFENDRRVLKNAAGWLKRRGII